ncbi:methionine-R-sulfoxide reductase [Allomyces macrogynus ATCC 38327]|uniref:Peptide-methionine (R)-S-oxide reductase n=1 Tax=Allomyces macrogynus (strain ATCC 38327) TaxID=578462 RepID=A0A0L0TBZ1_ALLM3|nr:methionine-R-sulfoxide reductase [Allomyces macrogynus ATCC 38327]|eukprot:KNE72272.1 methionine-R-sulfoxide reductase [Allomyces macrogynus ATCC 38327]
MALLPVTTNMSAASRMRAAARFTTMLASRSCVLNLCNAAIRPIRARPPARSSRALFIASHRQFTTRAPDADPTEPVIQHRARVTLSDDEWRHRLTPEEFLVLRRGATEPPGTGEYVKHTADGVYHCAGCDAPLYKSTTKFDSGCGWPAFYDAVPGAVTRREDRSHGMTRVEIRCSSCDGHLGHVFHGEGFPTPTDDRHCVNSVCLSFTSAKPVAQ